MIRIASDGWLSSQINVTDDAGRKIDGISSIKIESGDDMLTTATIEIALKKIDVEAHPMLGIETLTAAASLLGLKLVPKDAQ